MVYLRSAFVSLFVLSLTATTTTVTGQELRGVATEHGSRALFFGWLFGNDDDEDDGNKNDRGFFGNLFCFFSSCDDDNSNPVGDLIQDILNTSDGSTPIRDALNASRDSETPLRDFLGELLDQPDSDTPVRDFIDEAFNRTDTPFLDFIADLFNTTSNRPIRDFVRDLINGTESPLQEAIEGWFDGEVFTDLNCTKPAGAPACAYNVNGDEGVWVCRTLYNPFRGEPKEETHCAVPGFTLAENDKCGSCSGSYPSQCPCACSVNDDGVSDGVYVTLGDDKSCINAKFAITAVNRYDSVSCVASTECPV